MKPLSELDVTTLASDRRGQIAVQVAFGLLCALAMITLRTGIDIMAPTSGPFALVYPAVLIATLFGHLLAGSVCWLVCLSWAWWFVLKPVNSFAFEDPSDPARVIINALASLVVIGLAEVFRKAVRNGNAARDAEIERREVLMEELDHRTKNNFAMVSSLLAIQKRDVESAEAVEALELASARVHMFSRAYENLSETRGEGYPVEMREYLEDVIARVQQGGFDEKIRFTVRAASGVLPRQTAVVIGIFVNEAITNCAKYAFPDDRPGRIDVSFALDEAGWQLVVADDGVGSNAVAEQKDGRGAKLMAAMARQVDAEHRILTSHDGTRVEVRHIGEPA